MRLFARQLTNSAPVDTADSALSGVAAALALECIDAHRACMLWDLWRMPHLIWDQLVHRRGRAAALMAGLLVAAVSFSLLTAATNTQSAQVTGSVQQNLRPAYDILVRPRGSDTALEKSQDLVRDNYLSGIFGGITMAQYQTIKKIPGVEIAAPIAMIGYILETVDIPIDVTAALSDAPAQVLTLTDHRVADSGLTGFPADSLGLSTSRLIRSPATPRVTAPRTRGRPWISRRRSRTVRVSRSVRTTWWLPTSHRPSVITRPH